MKKLLSGILILPFLISAHTTFALSDTLQARKDATNITREGNRIIQEATKSVKKLSDTSVKKFYLKELNEEKNNLSSLANYIADFPSWDTKEARAKHQEFIQNTYLPSLKNLKQEIQTNPLSSKINTNERTMIENDILSYQKEILLPIQEFLEQYSSGNIKSTGNSAFEYQGTLGNAKIAFDSMTSLTSLISDHSDLDTTIQLHLDLAIPPETRCDYDSNDEYICTPKTATGRLALDATLELSIGIRDDAIFITPKRFSYIPVALPTTGEYAFLSGSLARGREIILATGGKTTYRLPIDASLSTSIIHTDTQKQIQLAKDILHLFTSRSVVTPIAKNTDGYLLGSNPQFTQALGKILNQQKDNSILSYDPIRYTNGVVSINSIQTDGSVYATTISRENGSPKIEIHFQNTLQNPYRWDYVQVGKNLKTHFTMVDEYPIDSSLSGTSTFDASLENGMVRAQLYTPTLKSFYTNTFTYPLPSTPVTLDLRGSFSLKNSNLYASLGGHDFAQLKWYYSDTASHFYGWINAYKEKFTLSSESNQTRGTFTYQDYSNVSPTSIYTLSPLLEPSTK